MYFSLFTFFTVSGHILGPTVCVSHFARYSVFLAIFQFLQCEFLIFLVGQLLCHISGPTVWISDFSHFLVFLAIFIQSFCLILNILQFSSFNSGFAVCISHFSMLFSVSCQISILHWGFFILQVFQCFSPYSRSYSVCVSLYSFFRFLTKFQFLQCVFLIFHVFHCFSP